jgi:cell division protein FtsB
VRRAVRLGLLAFAVVAVLALFVLPARTLLGQSHSLSATQQRISTLAAENAKLHREAEQLQSNADIEQIARADYGLVMPGEQAYAVIPSTTAAGGGTAATTTPAAASPAGGTGG